MFADNDVSVAVDTNYPFSDVLTTTITAAKAFTYYVRIPSWVVDGTIAVNGGEGIAVAPTEGLQAVAVGAGTTTFVLNLPAPITIGKSITVFAPYLLTKWASHRESPARSRRHSSWPSSLRVSDCSQRHRAPIEPGKS